MAKQQLKIKSVILHKALQALKGVPSESTISELKFKGVEIEEVSDGLAGIVITYKGVILKVPAANIAQINYEGAE